VVESGNCRQRMPDEAKYHCESCGEEIVVPVDLSGETSQTYAEDCPVCCRPNLIHVEIEGTGEVRVWAERSRTTNESEPLPVVLVRQGDHLRQRFPVPALRKVPNGRQVSEVPEAARDSLCWIRREKSGKENREAVTKSKNGRATSRHLMNGSGCGPASTPNSRHEIGKEFANNVRRVLQDQHVVVSFNEREQFIDQLSRSVRQRRVVAHRWSKNRQSDDIIGLIQKARDSGDSDEAVWRSFLAAHFGRASAKDEKSGSASAFLCAFGAEPFWTCKRVSKAPGVLRRWLSDHAVDLKSLSFGNHRKYESKRPKAIWSVVESFLTLAEEYGGPQELFTIDGKESDAAKCFDLLYRRLQPLRQFGRTGRFDFLSLLIELKLVVAEPGSCYLEGATGPLQGAKRLWGKRSIGQLEQLAADLAERVSVSPMALEDALCNWQK
jgi:hypothetical protein